ncbi:MAG: rhodanese-like domain-containing protein [Sulfuricaulis sp.]
MRQMTALELKERLEQKNGELLVIDVREPWELNVCSLPGAMPIPMRAIPARYMELPKDSDIVLMCHHGIRSQQVASFLERQGFTRLNNLTGGIAAWARDVDPGMPTY